MAQAASSEAPPALAAADVERVFFFWAASRWAPLLPPQSTIRYVWPQRNVSAKKRLRPPPPLFPQMSNAVFLDGIALGAIVPAPITIFVTFVGFVGGRWAGAICM